jgi:hypothetical protein
MSYTSSHSVLLAYSKVPFGLGLISAPQFVDAIDLPKGLSRQKGRSENDLLVIKNLRNMLVIEEDAENVLCFGKVTYL